MTGSLDDIRMPTDRDFCSCPWLARDMQRFGPHVDRWPVMTLSAADTYCRRLARCHGENFVVASLMLPRRLRRHFCRIYAYCRWADDLADETDDLDYSLRLLDWWQLLLHACYSGHAKHPVFIALRDTILSFGLPVAPFLDLLCAFRQDQQVRRYASFEDLLDYCRRSANPVGRLILCLAECCDADCYHWSDSICTGLQLANFCQGVAHDFAGGRIYVPREDIDRFECSEADFALCRATTAMRQLMQFEVARADEFLQVGRPLVERVPRWLRADTELFIQGGLEILGVIRRLDYDVWTREPRIGRVRKMQMLARSWWRSRFV